MRYESSIKSNESIHQHMTPPNEYAHTVDPIRTALQMSVLQVLGSAWYDNISINIEQLFN